MGKYIKKKDSSRAQWSEESLIKAVTAVREKKMGVNEASRNYGIPSRTLRRRIIKNSTKKIGLGPYGVLGYENEIRLVNHIKRLETCGFAPTSRDLRMLAYSFGEKLGLEGKFNKDKRIAGYDWFRSFMQRHPNLSVRQAEGLSVARAQSLNRETVSAYFEVLKKTLVDNELIDKPGHIFNMDESGLQIINKVGKVVATKGSKEVYRLTSGEKGETVTVIACCNAEGNFLPPVCILKGVNKKAEFEDGMPAGSKIIMNRDSAYINSNIFLTWLKEHFVPRKPPGKVLLLLDGHASHCNEFEMLEFAVENDILLLCLPPHTTKYLQPLDRTFFKPLKEFYNRECNSWFMANKGRKISRLQFGALLGKAWGKAATNSNATSGFRATGIYPVNENSIPDYAFAVSDHCTSVEEITCPTKEVGLQNAPLLLASPITPVHSASPSTSKTVQVISTPTQSCQKETPTKILMELSPPPKITKPGPSRARRSLNELVLTGTENIEKRQNVCAARKLKSEPKKANLKRRANKASTVSESLVVPVDDEDDDGDDDDDDDDDRCKECNEFYYLTKEECDWIKCCDCGRWLHENCTIFPKYCIDCGRKQKSKNNGKNAKIAKK